MKYRDFAIGSNQTEVTAFWVSAQLGSRGKLRLVFLANAFKPIGLASTARGKVDHHHIVDLAQTSQLRRGPVVADAFIG